MCDRAHIARCVVCLGGGVRAAAEADAGGAHRDDERACGRAREDVGPVVPVLDAMVIGWVRSRATSPATMVQAGGRDADGVRERLSWIEVWTTGRVADAARGAEVGRDGLCGGATIAAVASAAATVGTIR